MRLRLRHPHDRPSPFSSSTASEKASDASEKTREKAGTRAGLRAGVAVGLSAALAVALLPLTGTTAAADPAANQTSSQPSNPYDGQGRPVLEARATLSADHLEPGPPSGAAATPANGRQGPFPGQVVPGFSAVVDRGDGTFWAMPDNGFGTKQNSADFLLRIYRAVPRWETAAGGPGRIDLRGHLSLRDPDRLIPWEITREGTEQRLLTGADFDIESLVAAPDGTFWVGEEFGPFLLHVDRTGRLLSAPVPFVDGSSPSSPTLRPGEQPRVAASRGFEALAASANGRYLYPVLEGQLGVDPVARRRWVYEFDTREGAYTGTRWAYETDQERNVVGDAFLVSRGRLLLVERDDLEGPAAVTKRIYEVDLRRRDRAGFAPKSLVVDALAVDNPALIGTGTGYGTGEDWSFPVQSFETVVRLRDGRLLIANDNNYPGNSARRPGTPDDVEMAVLSLAKARPTTHPLVVGHRGASGYRPEHTLASYQLAIAQCADYIEPDLVSTKDGVLVARHENEISGTTDVASRPEFAARRTTKTIDGVPVTGFFTEDFTLAELRTLRAKERLPQLRPGSASYDGLYQVPTLDEVLDLARRSRTCDGEPVGVYPETKHPTYFDEIGLSLEQPLVRELRANGLNREDAPVVIQSFETGNLRELDGRTPVTLAQLIGCSGAPYDRVKAGDSTTYADMLTRRGLLQIATYAEGLGACKDQLIPRRPDGTLAEPTPVIEDAHRAGLVVHGWTFRRENAFLPAEYRSSADPAAYGDMAGEIRVFLRAGMDGLFSDHPDAAVQAARTR